MDQHARELAIAGGKVAAGVGPIGYGIITLNDVALLVGIVTSLIVAAHTLWKWFHDHKDRQARAAGD